MSPTGTLFWLLASNSYPDHDGYTVYTSRVAASEAAPAWPPLSAEMADEVRTVRQLHYCLQAVQVGIGPVGREHVGLESTQRTQKLTTEQSCLGHFSSSM